MVALNHQAPRGQYRIISVDTFDGTDWHACDLHTLSVAEAYARREAAQKVFLALSIYDDQGRQCGDYRRP